MEQTENTEKYDLNVTHSNRLYVLSKICYKDAVSRAKPYFFKANIFILIMTDYFSTT